MLRHGSTDCGRRESRQATTTTTRGARARGRRRRGKRALIESTAIGTVSALCPGPIDRLAGQSAHSPDDLAGTTSFPGGQRGGLSLTRRETKRKPARDFFSLGTDRASPWPPTSEASFPRSYSLEDTASGRGKGTLVVFTTSVDCMLSSKRERSPKSTRGRYRPRTARSIRAQQFNNCSSSSAPSVSALSASPRSIATLALARGLTSGSRMTRSCSCFRYVERAGQFCPSCIGGDIKG